MNFFPEEKKKKRNIYENVYIGSFIYQLGIKVGQTRKEHKSSVNLFQQTPADKTYGDLLTSVNGKYILIEFKRDRNRDDDKEKNKADCLWQKCIGDIDLKFISRKCHFYCIGKEDELNCLFDYFAYIDFFYKEDPKMYLNFIDDYLMTEEENYKNVIEQMKEDIHFEKCKNKDNIGVNQSDFRKYLELLKRSHFSSSSESAGGIVLCVNDSGEMGMFSTENMNDLISKLDEKIGEDLGKKQNNDLEQTIYKYSISGPK